MAISEIRGDGTLLATRDITSWPYYDNGGYIGLWFISAGNVVLDDFGGGNVSQTPTATPTATATVTPTATLTSTPIEPTTTEVTAIPSLTPTPTLLPQGPITINYVYDPLYRVTEANYSTGDYYHYTYDAVGNRLSQTSFLGGLSSTTDYVYDDANRLTSVNGVTYTWDDNGNLLNDGVNEYEYDSANRLVSFSNATTTATYTYSGLGDRLSQTVNGNTTTYTLDLNAGLTQVLNDGSNTYVYGLGRIAQVNTTTEYFLGDALGSVRQLTDTSGQVTLTKSYNPYGEVLSSTGSAASAFAFTGEQQDASGLTYLRARYYASGTGRFLTRDTWGGDENIPWSFNRWNYVGGNPVNLTDPLGNFPPLWCQFMANKALYEGCVDLWYGIQPIHYFMMGEFVTGERGCYNGPSEYRAPGYIEGTGLTLASPSIANWLFAVESVYDFATMEHDYFVNGSFDISGLPGFGLSDFVWGGVGTQYAGYVYGLRTTERLVNQYPGVAFLGYLGISGGTGTVLREGIGVGIGTTGFVSASDPTIRGYSQYISISLGYDPLPIVDAGLGVIQMKSATRNRPSVYLDDKGVKAMSLYLDILLGRHSVWLSDFQILPSVLTLNSRFRAANRALKYATAYEDLRNENK